MPGVDLHPIGFRRALQDGSTVRRVLCPHSFPTETWASLAIEQVVVDTSGMQPRFLRNHLSWLEQPAIYTDCYQAVQAARRVFDDWKEEKEKRSK